MFMRRIVYFRPGRLLFGLILLLAVSSSALHARPTDDLRLRAVPALTIADQIPANGDSTVQVPISFAADGGAIAAITFVIEYDPTWLTFDPTDGDGDGLPDALSLALPPDFSVAVPAVDATAGTISIFIGDTTAPLAALSDGDLVMLTFDVGNPSSTTAAAVGFANDPTVSFGSTTGASVPGTAEGGTVEITPGTGSAPSGPALTIGTHSASSGSSVQVPVTFTSNGAQVAAVAFVVDYDENWLTLDPTDANGDAIPDAIAASLSPDFSITVPQVDATTGTARIFVGDLMPPLATLPDGALLTLTFAVGDSTTNANAHIGFAATPPVSFGTPTGSNIAGRASSGMVQIEPGFNPNPNPRPPSNTFQLYLPIMIR
jgi:hypothetical protein